MEEDKNQMSVINCGIDLENNHMNSNHLNLNNNPSHLNVNTNSLNFMSIVHHK
jgi:hypothetical protein